MRLYPSLLAFSILAGLQGGCSSVRIAYNQADWYLVREISKVVCPSTEQRPALKRVATDFLRWHRRHELPRYAKAFRRIAGALNRPVSRELLQQTYALIDGARERASKNLERPLVGIGMLLRQKQARCLALALATKQRKRLAELGGSEAAYREKHGKKVIDTFEDWVGDLSTEQQAISRSLLDSQTTARAVAVARLNKGLRLVSALSSHDTRKKRRWLRAWVTDPYALYTAEERALLKRRDTQRRAQLWRLVKTLSAKQRERFKKKLLAYARDFEALAGDRS